MDNSITNHIGERIKYIRKLNNKSQIQFAEILGISQASLSEIESGKSKPMFDTLIKLGLTYQIDMNWLLNNSGVESLATLQSDDVSLINTYRQLEKVAQEEVIDYLNIKLKGSGAKKSRPTIYSIQSDVHF
jgi:transcriptional regulator with XRE-family HTH domain